MNQRAKIITAILATGLLMASGIFYFFRKEKTPSIQIIFPKSGEVLQTGSAQTIKWISQNIPASDKISITIRRIPPPPLQTEGQEFDPIIFVNLPNTGSADWTISDMYPEGNYVLGITAYKSLPVTNPVTAESEEFSIMKGNVAGLQCHDSQKYFAIEKSLAPLVGSNILIKYKTSPSQIVPCDYAVASGDFELENVLAEYFLAFTDNFLVLDRGTAPPPRILVAYDLNSRKKVFTDSYTQPVMVEGDSITYFSKTSIKPTAQNCPKLNEYVSNGLGAAIMSKVTVDLNTLVKKTLGDTECIATQ